MTNPNCTCGTPIREHEAGRKTDICVAQKMNPEQTDLIIGMGHLFLQGDGKSIEIPNYSTGLNHAIEFAKFVCGRLNKKYGNEESCRRTTASVDSSIVSFVWFEQTLISRHSGCITNKNEALAICIAGLLTLEKLEDK